MIGLELAEVELPGVALIVGPAAVASIVTGVIVWLRTRRR